MGILDNAKEVAKAVEEIHNLELYRRVLNLHSDIIEVVEENNRLRDENAKLKKHNDISGRIRLASPYSECHHVYFLYKENGQQEDGPFCTVCWDIDGKLVRPVHYRNDDGTDGYLCEYCRSHRSRSPR